MTIVDQEELARVKTELAAAVSNGDTARVAELEAQVSGLPVVVEAAVEPGPVEEKAARPSRKQATSRPRGKTKETR